MENGLRDGRGVEGGERGDGGTAYGVDGIGGGEFEQRFDGFRGANFTEGTGEESSIFGGKFLVFDAGEHLG